MDGKQKPEDSDKDVIISNLKDKLDSIRVSHKENNEKLASLQSENLELKHFKEKNDQVQDRLRRRITELESRSVIVSTPSVPRKPSLKK